MRLRYLLGGDRPSQTAHLKLSPDWIDNRGLGILASPEWYLTVGSVSPTRDTSVPPTYPAQAKPGPNSRLQ